MRLIRQHKLTDPVGDSEERVCKKHDKISCQVCAEADHSNIAGKMVTLSFIYVQKMHEIIIQPWEINIILKMTAGKGENL